MVWWIYSIGKCEPDGRFPIGFDDGELRMSCERELTALYSMNKLSAITVNGGLVHDSPSPLKAAGLCYISCGADRVPVGVLLLVDHQKLADAPIYHSHIVSVEAVAAAISSSQRQQPARASRNKEGQSREVDTRAGYHTFRRGDRLLYLDMSPEDGIDSNIHETCFGVMVVTYRRTQQLRFVISFDSATERFSVAPWTAWRRMPK